jgi:hypothetical protein
MKFGLEVFEYKPGEACSLKGIKKFVPILFIFLKRFWRNSIHGNSTLYHSAFTGSIKIDLLKAMHFCTGVKEILQVFLIYGPSG